ncbi:host specificity factor TipJ family phage tail protein [Methylorubrum zatmanii]
MTVVAFSNVAGQARGEPIRLPGRRRRLSTVVARHRPVGRRFIVSVHRNAIGEASLVPSDATVRLRANWRRTLIGPRDVVVITLLPLGGGSSNGGGGKSALGIGLAIASIALIAIAPYAAPALAGAAVFGAGVGATTGTLATAIQVGMVVGGIALGAAAQLASGAGAKAKNRTLYNVTGGGNVPRANARKPLLYGRCWSTPPLSQRDFFRYDGDTMVLTKRMTLGLGRFKIHAIKAGEATFWTEEAGLVAPFNVAGNAIEFLYETPSQLAVGDAVSSGDVAGQELPRPGGNPAVTPWFRLAPQGVTVDQALLSWSYQSVSRTSSAGRQTAGYAGVVFMARRIDPVTGAAMGAPFELLRDAIGPVLSPATALRYTKTVRLPARGAYEVYGQNLYPAADFAENKASWDELVGLVDDVRIRPATTEVVIQVRAGPGLNFAAFSDVSVHATRILPVWDGSTWTEQPTRKAVWAAADLVRNQYGLDAPDGFDLAKALHYIGELQTDDTFDGALPEVSSYWEAAGMVLLPMRADPVKVGVVHSFVRDESRDEPRHVLTRRQIVRDSGGASFKLLGDGGDVIVEFDRDGDPKRPDEARYSYGTPSRTPRRYKVPGIVDGDHALRHAKWLALISVFRGASRTVVTEWDGRLIYPGDHVLSDLWFLKGPVVYGVASAIGRILTLDCDANLSGEWGYGSIRTRFGREWGLLRMRGLGGRRVELHADDVATLEARRVQTVDGPIRLRLADVLARDGQDPTTLVIGKLEELQETYVVRAAIPTDADHVRIEMLQDDRRIWDLLGEVVHGPLPVNADPLAEALQPNIKMLRARCERIETGIEVVWSIDPPRGGRSYAVWLSYDGGATREPLSSGTAINGRAPIRQSESVVTVIAVAFGRTGLAGDEATTTFTTVTPRIDGSLTEIVRLPPIDYAGLSQDVRNRIENAQATAEHGVETAEDALGKAGTALDRALESLGNDAVNAAGLISEQSARVTQDGAISTRVDGVVARTDANAAAVISEQTARTTADGAIATRIDTLVARTDTNLAAVTSEQTARTSADGALGQRIDTVSARTDVGLAAVTSEQTARVSADGVIGQRIDTVVARTDAALAGVGSEQAARVSTDGVLAQRIDSVVARTDAALAGVSSETSARITADGAIASRVDAVQAQTDRGTAFGRMTLQARSDVSGVSARFETLLATQVGGQIYGAGFYIDLMPDGRSRYVIDADAFYITKNGQSTPAFQFDGYTLTIPSLRVTQQAILPGAATDPLSLVAPSDLDAGASSDDWREIPGTGYTLVPDGPGWSIFFSGVARAQVTAVGTAQLYLASSIQIAIGVDGVPYGGGGFFTLAAGSGAGAAPIPNTNTSGLTYSNAGLEILVAGQSRRFSLLYKFKADPGGSGKILYAQLKVVIIKR